MKRLISGLSHYSEQYKNTTANWLAFNNDISKILEITHARLVAANVYYGSFGKIIESLPHLENFKVPVVEDPFAAKVGKTLASLSFANNSSGRFFGFVKCSGCPGYVKKPFFFMEIDRSPQSLVNKVICPLLSVVNSAGDRNGE